MCPEKFRLIQEHADAASALFLIASTLTSKTRDEFKNTLAAARSAHEDCVRKHESLNDHIAQHGC